MLALEVPDLIILFILFELLLRLLVIRELSEIEGMSRAPGTTPPGRS